MKTISKVSQIKDSTEFLSIIVRLLKHIPADQHSDVGMKLAFLGLGLFHANKPGDFENVRAAIANLIPAAPKNKGGVTHLAQRQAPSGARITVFDLPEGVDF